MAEVWLLLSVGEGPFFPLPWAGSGCILGIAYLCVGSCLFTYICIYIYIYIYLCRFTIGDSVLCRNEPGRKRWSSLLVANFGLWVPLNLCCFNQPTDLGKCRGWYESTYWSVPLGRRTLPGDELLALGREGITRTISCFSSGGKWDTVFDNKHEIKWMSGTNCQERWIPQLEVSPVLDGLSPNPPTWCCSSPSDGNRACIELQQLHTIVSVPGLSQGMPVVPTVLQHWAPSQQYIHTVKPTVITSIPWTQEPQRMLLLFSPIVCCKAQPADAGSILNLKAIQLKCGSRKDWGLCAVLVSCSVWNL